MVDKLAEVEPGVRPSERVHTPQVGAKLSVDLRGETTRSTVEEVLEPTRLVVKLDVMEPMSKSHGYYFGDRVIVAHRRGLGGIPRWEATGRA